MLSLPLFLGCVGMEVGPVPEGSSIFQKGYIDGANSGYCLAGHDENKWQRDYKLFSSNLDYKRGWEEGFYKKIGTLKTSKKTDFAIQLAAFDDKISEAELINYFSLKPHKAFAINPLKHKQFWWTYKYNSESSAINNALNKCGSLCILFAVEDDIVLEQKLEEWEKKYIEDRNNFSKKLDKYNNTIFHHVLWEGNFKYANRLIENGVDINIGNKYDATALLINAENGHFDSVEFLIKNGADLNKPNINKATPLWAATSNGHIGIVTLLIENGADLNKKAKDGNSPLGIAKTKGHKEIVELLERHGAK